ncbi:hypothetical protein GLOTRDRAFT_138382 [Gloeophyllum trabeum ATCC 11539]|uniref:F-box domain-containing protein n=1 Tax=Gloeophyllum trabeum (strain ATCC 11539 / FP-39264 / Madison 617) TaxID=670483 RepID=S7QA03_GLOTA|nr:uncharacterized protein GLOTRDRAFT_138382 [Gloeophyllum trabeum ATCC 11539]EPQ56731.1 hypothetical protein GLOTRDRAFT_138382 [Gloeophyllum trabeum ATCC 11539]
MSPPACASGKLHYMRIYRPQRQLVCTSSTLLPNSHSISGLRALDSVTISCALLTLGKQSRPLKLILAHLPARITSLTLTALARIDAALLRLIAGVFPALTTLELSVAERLDYECCANCFAESASCVVYAPIPHHHRSAEALGEALGSALQPLKALRRLFLGLLLCHADTLTCFDFNCPEAFNAGRQSPEAVRTNEGLAAAAIVPSVPSLETITWGLPPHQRLHGTDHRAEPTSVG